MGNYSIDAVGMGPTTTHTTTLSLDIWATAPGQAGLTAPANGATGVATAPTLTWNALSNVAGYDIDIATDPGFTTIVEQATGLATNSYSAGPLSGSTVYYWRVRGINACGSVWSATSAFRTSGLVAMCTTYPSTDVPKTISASGTPSVSSIVNVGASGTVTDINLLNLNVTHTWVSDLDLNLISPATTAVIAMVPGCTSLDNIDINLDDEAAPGAWPCPPTDGGTYQPTNPLSAFDGETAAGVWTLRIDDNFNQDGGALNSWSLEVCSEDNQPTPAADYSDLDASFGIAWHEGNGALRLGSDWDADTSFAPGQDDGTDDGVAIAPLQLTIGRPMTIAVSGTATNGVWLQVWFDWDGSGSFAGSELVHGAAGVVGDNIVTVTTPDGTSPVNDVAYRVRLFDSSVDPGAGPVGALAPSGGTSGGEVGDGLAPPPSGVPTAVTLLGSAADSTALAGVIVALLLTIVAISALVVVGRRRRVG